MADMFKLSSVQIDVPEILRKRGLDNGGEVQRYIDTECLKYSNEYAPFREHTLIESSTINTKIGSGHIVYQTPYARRLYYHPEYNFSKEKNPRAGGMWFDRMKNDYREQILKGAARIARGG